VSRAANNSISRLGLTAPITAPIIHAGFSGKTTLEIVNHGPLELLAPAASYPGMAQPFWGRRKSL